MMIEQGISANDLLHRLRELSHRVEAGLEGAQQPQGADFSELLRASLDRVNGVQQSAASLARAHELSDPAVSITDLTIAMQKSSLAFQAATQVRNKLVAAYQEIMSMQV
ncbi:MAG: flagellar hook-basal body complex protein FliE [Chromatiaceae bacterium]|jgi:flagellar hook-basal body complex protein FliE